MNKKVIITGVTGQDGSYMVEYLLEKTNYEIIGIERRVSNPNRTHLSKIDNPRVKFITADVTDANSMDNLIRVHQPDYFINFAANSFVGNSWDMPYNHIETNFLAVLHQLEGIRKHAPHCRYYQAGSSEQWGDVDYWPQDEKHPFKPRSPYAVAKCAASHLVKVYRESYKLYAIQGILFNHESPRRGSEFVTQKIVENAVRISKELLEGGPVKPMQLGNIEAKRDWSHAKDFVDGIWRMLNQEQYNPIWKDWCQPMVSPHKEIHWSHHIKEYVLASGVAYTVREFIEKTFANIGVEVEWVGPRGKVEERLIQKGCPNVTLAEISRDFYRPAEVNLLLGDSSLARKELQWSPKYDLDKLIAEMVQFKLIHNE